MMADILLNRLRFCISCYKRGYFEIERQWCKSWFIQTNYSLPSPEKRLEELGKKFKKVLVVELNQGQYYEEIQRAMGRKDIEKLTKTNGRPFSPADIIEKVKEVF